MKKNFVTGFIAGAIIFSAVTGFAVQYIANPVDFKVLVNGEEFISDPPALEVDGRTYLPLRAMGEALGVPVNWNEELYQAEVGSSISAPAAETNDYSRSNPAPINTVQQYTSKSDYYDEYNYTVAVRVLEVRRGDKIYEEIKNAYLINSYEPEEGYEYLQAKIAFSVVSTKGDFSVEPTQNNFKSFTSNNEECPDNIWTFQNAKPSLEGSLYEGGNTDGWITVKVKKDDATPKMAYGLDYNGAGGIWFKLYN